MLLSPVSGTGVVARFWWDWSLSNTRKKKPPTHRHSKYGWSRSFVTTPPLGKACPTHTILICQILRFDRSLFRQSTERGRAKKNSSKFRLSASVDPRAIDVWFLWLLVVFPTNTGYSDIRKFPGYVLTSISSIFNHGILFEQILRASFMRDGKSVCITYIREIDERHSRRRNLRWTRFYNR